MQHSRAALAVVAGLILTSCGRAVVDNTANPTTAQVTTTTEAIPEGLITTVEGLPGGPVQLRRPLRL